MQYIVNRKKIVEIILYNTAETDYLSKRVFSEHDEPCFT